MTASENTGAVFLQLLLHLQKSQKFFELINFYEEIFLIESKNFREPRKKIKT